ncbi:hypothetical protein Lesp02_79130 [Lentzea sp. NBRC 105346]|uniref:hypothetical protein n=1 Tax=Lentzea sp. NBRC 105346 TaxID=3032205 RepID=UPI0024A44CA9|nr:hypothetical protein [Lentzea sp. NBRC 105346]GLZ35726.1 hypothetical protein Lesp02_79130 [Lentzea sp. NBRC 105346]
MRKTFAILAAFFLTVVMAPSASAAQYSCNDNGIQCWFYQRNYVDQATYTFVEYPSGYCEENLVFERGGIRSYMNKSNNEGYWYSNTNCTGSRHAMKYYSNDNIGFEARSFRAACISCIAPADH